MYITLLSFAGGSSYSEGCLQSDPIIFDSGITATTIAMVLPGGSTQAGYTSGVGVGGSGIIGYAGSSGENGSILLTFSDVGFVTE